ncbi:MAG: transcriptional repressor [Acidobacteriota bacterium]
MLADAAQLLRHHGLQVTAQRLAVLRAVAEHCHCTADDVASLVRADIGAISRQAVYDALTALVEAGLLRRIQPAGSPARYETRTGDNHHHLICRACGRTVDVDCAVGHAPCLTPADSAGFRVDEAEVVYWGICPGCLAPAEHPSPNGEPTTAHRDRGSSPPHSGNSRAKARLRLNEANNRRES